MKQNEFIQSVIDILKQRGEKYSRYEVENDLWAALRNLNKERGRVDSWFTIEQEAFVRRCITALVIEVDKVWNYTVDDVKRCIVKSMEEVAV